MCDTTVAQIGTKFSHRVMNNLAEYFAEEAGYDPDIVDRAHNEVMTNALGELSPEMVNELFEDPPEELEDYTNVLGNMNRAVVTTDE